MIASFGVVTPLDDAAAAVPLVPHRDITPTEKIADTVGKVIASSLRDVEEIGGLFSVECWVREATGEKFVLLRTTNGTAEGRAKRTARLEAEGAATLALFKKLGRPPTEADIWLVTPRNPNAKFTPGIIGEMPEKEAPQKELA